MDGVVAIFFVDLLYSQLGLHPSVTYLCRIPLSHPSVAYPPAAQPLLSAVQANDVIITAGKISFSNLNLDWRTDIRTIYVYSDSNYSNQITSFTLSSDPGTNPELNLGKVSDSQAIYFRYAIQFIGTTYYTVSATVAELTSTAGLNLEFDN